MITIKNPEEIQIMATGGKILASVLSRVAEATKVGITLKELDQLAEKLTRNAGAIPAFLNYRPDGAAKPYPASLCASVNDIVVHGIPNTYKLRSGDILTLDYGVKYKNFYTDSAVTIAIGKINETAQKLIDTTKKALLAGIKQAKIGNHIGDIGHAIKEVTTIKKFKIIEGLTGHGIGRELHEDPTIWNEGRAGTGEKITEGMVLAIEPMISAGSSKIIQLKDDSYATYDGSLSAHFEHTVAITKNGPVILT